MKLADLHPQWVDALCRKGIGLLFDCPAAAEGRCSGRHLLLFLDPLDGGPRLSESELLSLPADLWALHPGCPVQRWHRVGTTFDELSLSPRIDSACGWGGWLAGGRLLLGGPKPRELSPETKAWLAGEFAAAPEGEV